MYGQHLAFIEPATAEPGSAALTSVADQYLSVQLAGNVFGFGILAVREIIVDLGRMAMPLAPAWMRGVIDLRGTAVPVVDLAARFGHDPAAPNPQSCIVITDVPLATGRQTLGVLVDAVNEVLTIPAADIAPGSSLGASAGLAFIRGMGKVRGGFVILLDLDRLFDEQELAHLLPSGGLSHALPTH
ncbi:chemotaxis protein CheW [Pseudacidovorax intermedius]|uniref:chemotaxis protein CheW n=1 Tax=Pseudacidovorax intermedius TaxID=433924 RepID=UPI000733CEAC|nr:chemotaxis protein CheW [Pseudacidovorax intermedius]